jgi:hypothetical protein
MNLPQLDAYALHYEYLRKGFHIIYRIIAKFD